MGRCWIAVACLAMASAGGRLAADERPSADEVLRGLRAFYAATARPDGSFAPGVDPDYLGMSDCAYSDLAATTYACTVHKTFGWKLPLEEKTIAFLHSRQRADGAFFNVAGTVDPDSAEGRTYNTTQGLVALRALGQRPRHNPLPVFEEILKADYKELPPYATSFFPLAYLCYGQPIPAKADQAIRALMVQDETGYLNDHIAATFHASHYYRLVGEPTPKSQEMVQRVLRDQKPDGSWLLNLPSRDRHGTFDAVFVLRQEGHGRKDCRAAIGRAVDWVLSCRNPDGGFGHYPGSTSDADAVYFHVGVLVMAGFLPPADPLPQDPHLLSWGHLMPPPGPSKQQVFTAHVEGWVGGVAFSPRGQRLAAGSADGNVRLWSLKERRQIGLAGGHRDAVAAVAFSPDGKVLLSGSYDATARLWDTANTEARHVLRGHRGAVLAVAIHPTQPLAATGGFDGTIRLWDTDSGQARGTLSGHRSWVNALAFDPEGKTLLSASSDGTLGVWSLAQQKLQRRLEATKAEVRSLAVTKDGLHVAAGIRYGQVQWWNARSWDRPRVWQAHRGDVWAVGFSPDGRLLATADGDWNRPGTIKLWNTDKHDLHARLQHTGEVLCLAFSPDGRHLAAGAADKTLRVWDLHTIPPRSSSTTGHENR